MTARQAFSLEIRHAFPPVDDLACWVLLPGPCSRPVVIKRSKAPAGPTAQDLVWLREWLLFAYLAPADYRETDRPAEPDGVGVIETARLRDALLTQQRHSLANQTRVPHQTIFTAGDFQLAHFNLTALAQQARAPSMVAIPSVTKSQQAHRAHHLPPLAKNRATPWPLHVCRGKSGSLTRFQVASALASTG